MTAQATAGWLESFTPFTSTYERMCGNCTRLVATDVVSNIIPSITTSSYILDNACGPGIVSEQIKRLHPDAKIMAIDITPGMIDEIEERIKDGKWNNMQTKVGDSRSLPELGDDTFTHAINNFGLIAPNDPQSCLKICKEMYRVLKVGGVAVGTTWCDRVFPLAFMNVAKAIKPNEAPRNPMMLPVNHLRASHIAQQFEDAGFGTNIEIKRLTTYTSAKSFDELIDNMMLAGPMVFVGYNNDETARAKSLLREEVKKLKTFEESSQGARIGMKAWIVIGTKVEESDVPY